MINMSQGGTRNVSSLTERLKPWAAAKLKQESKQFPHAIGAIMDELNIYVSVIDLRYGTVISLSNFLDLNNYTITELSTLFEQS